MTAGELSYAVAIFATWFLFALFVSALLVSLNAAWRR